jgi:hypothetical protein
VKRSFKAATVFAGVGAMTGVFAPAALAAPAHTTAAANPDINPAKECGANNGGVSNWVHLYYPNNDHPAECIAGRGTENVTATIASFCPGNNNGAMYSATNPFPFSHGQGRHPVSHWTKVAGNDHVAAIDIFSWTGAAKCLG